MGGPKSVPTRTVGIFLLAALIGVAGGLLGAGFQHMLVWIQNTLVGEGDQLSDAVRTHLSTWQTLLVPTLGGVAAGLALMLRRDAKAPFGITDIIGLVALRKGTIRFRDSLAQILVFKGTDLIRIKTQHIAVANTIGNAVAV